MHKLKPARRALVQKIKELQQAGHWVLIVTKMSDYRILGEQYYLGLLKRASIVSATDPSSLFARCAERSWCTTIVFDPECPPSFQETLKNYICRPRQEEISKEPIRVGDTVIHAGHLWTVRALSSINDIADLERTLPSREIKSAKIRWYWHNCVKMIEGQPNSAHEPKATKTKTMRKLATVRRIRSIEPIPGADRIDLAKVDGWQTVVKKGEFQVGDLAVYIEYDAFLPVPLVPWLGSQAVEFNGLQGVVLRTMRMQKTLTQGLLLPIPEHIAAVAGEGTDLTQELGIQLYEKPLPEDLYGTAKGYIPSFIHKTSQERVQNIPNELESWAKQGLTWEVTEKLDGLSATYYYNEGVFGVCTWQVELLENPDNKYWKIAYRYQLRERLADIRAIGRLGFGHNIALQGELVGPGIRGNPYQLKEVDFFVFDVWDINLQMCLQPAMRRQLVETLGLKHVPVCFEKAPSINNVADHLKVATRKSQLNDVTLREGVVWKSNTTPDSFKVISNEHLLEESKYAAGRT